ncbi:hypothetical protein B0H67DRAFT_640946 [Lasiosphaeris hirsuta]|uniref:Uncharacterized protein n=1 Tax=Lasiosphaeris hirsuta TaxID=260670 RepID=A0AA40E581_9PEZI|nr:hypothetical protein B0H67DRAFT_640946 [Lasiosphaeris hirsuta]
MRPIRLQVGQHVFDALRARPRRGLETTAEFTDAEPRFIASQGRQGSGLGKGDSPLFALGGVFATVASAAQVCSKIPCSGKCASAVAAIPEVGEDFCSSYLSLEITSTVIEVSTTTSVHANIETNVSVETVTVKTSTACSSKEKRISSACSCLLSSTSSIIVSVFETSLLPWTDSVATTGGQLDIITGLNVCGAGGDCPGGSVVIRAYPAKTANSYLSIKQTLTARPSTTYAVTYLVRCLNYDTTSGMDVFYKGVRVGGNSCLDTVFNRYTGTRFTTDLTGVGELEIRFKNGASALQGLYYYADDFQAIAIAV